MLRTKFQLLVVAFALAADRSAQADFITGGTIGSFAGGSVNSVSVVGQGVTGVGDPSIFAPTPILGPNNVVNIDVTVTKLFTSFSTILTLQHTAAGMSEYLMHITIHNNTGTPFASFSLDLGGSTFGASGSFNTAFLNNDVGLATDPINNHPGAFAWDTSSDNPSSNHLQYGGLNGGGGQLAKLGVTTVDAYLHVSKGTSHAGIGSITLTFTANPEPGTLLLGGLALSGLACYQLRRRRQLAENVVGLVA